MNDNTISFTKDIDIEKIGTDYDYLIKMPLYSLSQDKIDELQKELETLSQEQIAEMQKDIADKGRDLEFLAGKIQQAQEETAQAVFAQSGAAMQKIISELIAAKQIKVLLAKNETMLFSDPALDLTDDVTSMLDVAAAEATSQSD